MSEILDVWRRLLLAGGAPGIREEQSFYERAN
jgi:hypothetical protein